MDCHQPISRKVRWRVTFGIDSYLMRYKEVGAFGILLVDGPDHRTSLVRVVTVPDFRCVSENKEKCK